MIIFSELYCMQGEEKGVITASWPSLLVASEFLSYGLLLFPLPLFLTNQQGKFLESFKYVYLNVHL